MKQKLFLIFFLFSSCNCFAQTNDTASARLNNYRDKVLLVFYKCNSQDDAIGQAIKDKNVIEIEAGRIALLQCANDGMHQLDALESFDGDPALKFSCRDVLKFYKQLAESDIPQVSDFFIAEEKFLKSKNEFEKKPAKKHTKEEIYAYNNEIKKYNAAITHYTQLTTFISGSRKLTLYNWNASQKIFMDAHRPKP
ncbi:MAG: hypothetical protein JWO92_418 [Chitinophagaceae bacterium]|nr:hypothetical protein [Chitinophagaceae bacterium]